MDSEEEDGLHSTNLNSWGQLEDIENENSSPIILPALSEPLLNLWTDVNLFSEIHVTPEIKTIAFCDIDDTLLHHPFLNPTWTGILKLFFYMRNQQTLGISDEHKAVSESESYLNEVLNKNPILHSDREGFFGLVEKIDKLIFVTARPSESKEFTFANLRSIDVDPDKFEVHFCGSSNKGEYICKHFDLSGYDSVIFIDDQPTNLENVFKSFSNQYNAVDASPENNKNPRLDLYRFQRILEDPYTYYPFPPGFPSWYKFDGTHLVMASGEAPNPTSPVETQEL